MKSFKLINGQFQFDGQNSLMMVEGDDELMQTVGHIVTTNLGEWFLNPRAGWARFKTLGQKRNDQQTIDDLTTAILTGEPRVATVEDVELTFYPEDGRRLAITYRLTKQDGTQLTGEARV